MQQGDHQNRMIYFSLDKSPAPWMNVKFNCPHKCQVYDHFYVSSDGQVSNYKTKLKLPVAFSDQPIVLKRKEIFHLW